MLTDIDKKHMTELAVRSLYREEPCFTRFLEPCDETAARSAANAARTHVFFYGGYDDAERRIASFCQREVLPEEYPLRTLRITWKSEYSNPDHRDLLGALMALGIRRETTGDIVFGLQPGTAYLFCEEEIADFICANWESAGRTALRLSIEEENILLKEPEGTALRLTVQSPRLDAVVAEITHSSRTQAQKLITQGLVKRNHLPELRTDVHLAENDLLSIRGFGRVRIITFDAPTRKGRCVIRVFHYT